MTSTGSDLYIDFKPSFHLGMAIHISSSGRVTIDHPTYEREDKLKYSEDISGHNAATILARAAELLSRSSYVDNNMGLDGVKVKIKFIDANLKISKTIWSPSTERCPSEFLIVKLVYGVLWGLNAPISWQEKIEQLSSYFELGLPVKVTNENPYVIRFFGRMSANDQQDLKLLLGKIPVGVNVIIDMSNFDGMGTILYPEFERLLSRNLPIRWIANNRIRPQLLEIGVLASDLQHIGSIPLFE